VQLPMSDPPVTDVVPTADFDVDLSSRCVRYPDGEQVNFTSHQWRLLERLVRAAPRPVSRACLNAELFGADAGPDETAALDLVIGQLRRKLEPDPHAPRFLRAPDAQTFAFHPHGRAPLRARRASAARPWAGRRTLK
jgi:two-component system KDP operon response regulator KdpE